MALCQVYVIALNDMTFFNNELLRARKELVMIYFQYYIRIPLNGMKKPTENLS
jgi:hypothetical protein